jgi:hypothetical protein
MYQVVGSSLVLLDTELTPLDLVASGYDPNVPFSLISLSIMAYGDGYTSAQDPSLVADVKFQSISVALVPEPSCAVLAVISGSAVLIFSWRSRRGRCLVPL